MASISGRLPRSMAFTATHPGGVGHISEMQYYRLELENRERLFNSLNINLRSHGDPADKHAQVNFSSRLPGWLWAIVASSLGIDSPNRPCRRVFSTFLHVLTLASALSFAVCGLFFNIYDVLSHYTKTTVLLAICKCAPGAYWVGMGIYAHSLAARLFSNPRFVDSIRMHSKTIFKINVAIIILVLALLVVGTNFYWTSYLLNRVDDPAKHRNGTRIRDANCITIKADILICEIYYLSRIVYTTLAILWNLLVASILLSVCRTHTICIRRFMRELLYDTKIYEEFLMLRAFGYGMSQMEDTASTHGVDNKARMATSRIDSNIWADDVFDGDEDSNDNTRIGSRISSNAHILQSMRSMRTEASQNFGTAEIPFGAYGSVQPLESLRHPDVHVSFSPTPNFPSSGYFNPINEETSDTNDNDVASSPFPFNMFNNPNYHHLHHHRGLDSDSFSNASTMPIRRHGLRTGSKVSSNVSGNDEVDPGEPCELCSLCNISDHGDKGEQRDFEQSAASSGWDKLQHEATLRDTIINGAPPVLDNEDILYTYFQLVRRLTSTSRLLQRWMLTLIIFILMWCTLLIVYWTSHDADWPGLVEFLIPLIILYLLSSAYAEVNFEGNRLRQCVLPSEKRMALFYYMNYVPLELKVFSFRLSYASILTVVAGVGVTLMTRIILEQVGVS